jgi:hypothetical protein
MRLAALKSGQARGGSVNARLHCAGYRLDESAQFCSAIFPSDVSTRSGNRKCRRGQCQKSQCRMSHTLSRLLPRRAASSETARSKRPREGPQQEWFLVEGYCNTHWSIGNKSHPIAEQRNKAEKGQRS